jgi:hypothetical protein
VRLVYEKYFLHQIISFNGKYSMNSYDTLRELIGIDSPSGYTENATDYIVRVLQSYGWSPERTHKGAVRVALGKNPVLSIAAHTDTLGAMVSGVNGNGTYNLLCSAVLYCLRLREVMSVFIHWGIPL